MVEKLNEPVESLKNEVETTLKSFSKETKILKDKILKWRKNTEPEKFILSDEEKKEILDQIEQKNPNFKEIVETIDDTTTVLEIANLKITDEQLAIARPLIKTYTNLIEINLEDNNLENIEYIQELAKLRKINLQGNKIKTLENSEIFFGCTSLEEIDLSNNNIINFDANYLKNIRETLKILRINNNKQLEAELEDYEEKREKKLSILQWLENFKELEIIEAENNNITDSNFFANLPNLQELYLNGNLLVNLNDMKKLPNLTIIDISDNNFWNLKLIQSGGKNISKSLITNKGASISGLKKLPSLEKVILDYEVMKNEQYLKYVDWGNRLWVEDMKNQGNQGKWIEVIREKENEVIKIY